MIVGFLPSYSQEYNPIELMRSKVKALLCKADACANAVLFLAIGDALSRVTGNDSIR